MNVSKTMCAIPLVLFLFRIIGKTIKALGFQTIHICSICQVSICHPEKHSELRQMSKMEVFAKIVNGF